jgi:hypothetical protein
VNCEALHADTESGNFMERGQSIFFFDKNVYVESMSQFVGRKQWFRRNDLVHWGEFSQPNQVFREANASIDEFKRVNANECKSNHTNIMG